MTKTRSTRSSRAGGVTGAGGASRTLSLVSATRAMLAPLLAAAADQAGCSAQKPWPQALLEPADTLLELADVLLQPREVDLPDCGAFHGVGGVVHDVGCSEGDSSGVPQGS